MHHSFIDKYSDRSSIIHRVDAQLKIIIAFAALIIIIGTPQNYAMALVGYAIVIGICWLISRVPLTHLVKRLGIALPFVTLIAVGTAFGGNLSSPLDRFVVIVAKAALAITVLTILTSTTRFPQMLKGCSRLGMPRVISSIMAFLYRYIFILIDEAERLNMGRRSRRFSRSRRLAWKGRAWMTGALFVRSLERSERVYQAMLARGFSGQIHTL